MKETRSQKNIKKHSESLVLKRSLARQGYPPQKKHKQQEREKKNHDRKFRTEKKYTNKETRIQKNIGKHSESFAPKKKKLECLREEFVHTLCFFTKPQKKEEIQ